MFTSSNLHISFWHAHIFTSSHHTSYNLHIFSSSHQTFSHHTFSHLHIFTFSHLHIFSFSSSHLLLLTSSHLDIFLHIFSSFLSCPLTLSPSCPLGLPSLPLPLFDSCPLALFSLLLAHFSFKVGDNAKKGTFFAQHEFRSFENCKKLRFPQVLRTLFARDEFARNQVRSSKSEVKIAIFCGFNAGTASHTSGKKFSAVGVSTTGRPPERDIHCTNLAPRTSSF